MGNPLLKNYNVEKDHFLTGGFNNLWKIYKGSRKDRKQDVCVFVLEKKNLDKYSKEEREEILNVLKKEAGALVKFKHPSVLGIYEQLLEDKTTLVFVTEPVQYTLSSWVETTGVSKLEIKLMITELCNVMSFLHDDAHVIHTSLNPDEIFINPQGHIKLSGLSFSISDPSINGVECKLNSFFPNALPNLKFIAPEIVNESKAFYQSDIFSIGMIIYNLLKFHKGDTDRDLLGLNGSNSFDSYKKALEVMDNKLMRMAFENDDNSLIFNSLNKVPLNRTTIKEMLDHAWFNDPKLKALRFIENLEQNEAQKNSEFLSKFPNILHFFENKIIERRFLPAFMNALKIENLIVPTLPAVFSICESTTLKIDFEQNVWPGLKTLFQMKQIPAAGLYFLLSKLNYIAEKISNNEFSSNMLNIICKALDCGVAKIQSVVLDNLLFVIKKVDSLAFKNQIYPRLVNILLNTNSTSLKISILKSFSSVYSLLDQNIINESLLNNLEKVRKSDNNSEVCMCVVSIYEEIAKVVSVESIANKILPNLISILVSGNISRKNFENIMSLVQKYLSRIKESREKDLSDDTSTKLENKENLNLHMKSSSSSNISKNLGEKDDFSFLDSFFGGGPSGSSGSNITNTKTSNNNITSSNSTTTTSKNTFEFDYINKNLEEPSKKSPNFTTLDKKEKSIFDGIKDNSTTTTTNININTFNSSGNLNFGNGITGKSSNSSSNNNLDKFNFGNLNLGGSGSGIGSTNQNINNNTLNFNNMTNNKKENIKNSFPTIDFSKNNAKGNSRDLNMLDSLLNDLPSNSNNAGNNPTNTTTTTSGFNLNNMNNIQNNLNNNINLNNWDLSYNNSSNTKNNFPIQNSNSNSKNDDYYNLDFLKSNNKNTSNSTNNYTYGFDLTKGTQQSQQNKQQNDPFSGYNFSNNNINNMHTMNNKQNDQNKNMLDGLLKF